MIGQNESWTACNEDLERDVVVDFGQKEEILVYRAPVGCLVQSIDNPVVSVEREGLVSDINSYW